MSSSLKELYSEFTKINRKKVFEDQATIEFPEGEDNPYLIRVILKPDFGYFRGAEIKFRFKLPQNYPFSAPSVTCETKVYHPNISFSGSICFNMFSSESNSNYRLEQYINGLLWLLANPNPDSALNNSCVDKNLTDYAQNVFYSLMGQTIKGISYPKNEGFQPTFLQEFQIFKSNQKKKGFKMLSTTQKYFRAPIKEFLKEFESMKTQLASLSVLENTYAILFLKATHRVKRRARDLNVCPSRVLKEILFQLEDGRIILVISNGQESINLNSVASILQVSNKITLVPKKVITEKMKLTPLSIPIFFPFESRLVSHILVNERIFCIGESVFTASGSNVLVELWPQQLLSFISGITSCKVSFFENQPLQEVNFSWKYRGAKVSLAGSFNNWTPIPMNLDEDGKFYLNLRLPEGISIQYKFVLNDNEWCYDMEKSNVPDLRGNINNILFIPNSSLSQCSAQ